MKQLFLTLCLACAAGLLSAANTTTTVEQVSTAVTVSEDVDYVITSTTPFVEGGSINITDTEHAVVIIANIRPSQVISSWLGNYVKINGAKAVNNSNCQVRMYAQGAIIFPYSSNIKPLTVYSEQDFTGTSVNDFGLENTGGYMNTLTEEKLNNKIRSFKLKRGYMVTFSTRASGRGYSRCFIADQADLEVSTLPNVLDQTITSYRVFQWFNAPKKGLASDTNANDNAQLNSSWCYSWGNGENLLPDVECVPNHIYEDWPSSASCGSVTYSCHMKTNNEPGNASDDHPQDVATVLANWENLMRTGMRLCSESSHDGSMSHLKEFIDSIDARGWRCDILDLHCYWAAGTFNSLTWYSDNYGNGRPIWISEWVWGASWNNNGAFAVTDRSDYEGNWANTYNGTKPILDVLNSNSRVERYAYWNSEANCSKLLKDGQLSTLGQYYSTMNPGLGYNKSNEYIPHTPRMYTPSNLSATYDKANHQVILKWHEYNGEYNASMEIQYKKPNGTTWNTLKEIQPQEVEADYEESVKGFDGYKYRIRIRDVKSVERISNEATAVNENLEAGDDVTIGDTTMFLGGNLLLNGNFDFGLLEWQNGLGEPLSAPYFQAVPCGGINNGPYLQAYGNSTELKDAASVAARLSLEAGASYYVSAAGCNNNPKTQKISTTPMESLELYSRITLPAITKWSRQCCSFTTTTDTILLINLRSTAGIAQFDELMVCKLFNTREEALADALECSRQRSSLFGKYYSQYCLLCAYVSGIAKDATDYHEIENAITATLQIIHDNGRLNHCNSDLKLIASLGLPKADEATKLLNAQESANAIQIVQWMDSAEALVQTAFPYTLNSSLIKNPDFQKASGWDKVGNYAGGDQTPSTQAGSSCWNAWWSTPTGDGTSNMEIRQTITDLPHGLYALECQGATQHLCETDQHGYLCHHTDSMCTLPISAGLLDLSVEDSLKWNQLLTSYVYVDEGDTINVGFFGSKKGAVDGQWMPYNNPTGTGDNREGWWCATGFQFRYVPLYTCMTDESGWGTVCLPYKMTPADSVKLYKIAGYCNGVICIEPMTEETVAGTPYIYHCTPKHRASFFEDQSSSVITAKTNENGLRGALYTTVKYPAGALVLKNGTWTYIPDRNSSYPITSYSGYIQKTSNIPALESWSGETMPADSQAGLSIEDLQQDSDTSSFSFNLLGQPAHTPGLVIRNHRVIFNGKW